MRIKTHGLMPKLSDGGYASQLGKTSSNDGVLSQISSGIHQYVPPLSLKYRAVERAIAPDLSLVPIKVKGESAKAAAEGKKTAMDAVMKVIDSRKDWSEMDRQKFRLTVDDFEKGISSNLSKDPYYYANAYNAQELSSDIGKLVSSHLVTKYDQRAKVHESNELAIKTAGAQGQIILDKTAPMGRNNLRINEKGEPYTYSEYQQVLRARDMNDPELRREMGVSDKNEHGEIPLYSAFSTPGAAADELHKWASVVRGNQWSEAKQSLPGKEELAYGAQKFVNQNMHKEAGSSNEKQINAFTKWMKDHWRQALSEKASIELQQTGSLTWLRMTDKDGISNGLKMRNAMDAQQSEDPKVRAQGEALETQLVQKRDEYIGKMASDIILNKGETYKTTSTATEDVNQVINVDERSSGGSGSSDAVKGFLDQPGEIEVDEQSALESYDDFVFDEQDADVKMPVASMSSRQPDKNAKPQPYRTFNITNGYIHSKDVDGDHPRSGTKGKPVNVHETLYNVRHTANVTIPILTGKRYTAGNVPIDPDPKVRNRQVLFGGKNEFDNQKVQQHIIKEKKPIMDATGKKQLRDSNGNPAFDVVQHVAYEFVVDDEGNRYEVKRRAFMRYEGTNADPSREDTDIAKMKNTVVFEPMSMQDSQHHFGGSNYSSQRENPDYFSTQQQSGGTDKNGNKLPMTGEKKRVLDVKGTNLLKEYVTSTANKVKEVNATLAEVAKKDPNKKREVESSQAYKDLIKMAQEAKDYAEWVGRLASKGGTPIQQKENEEIVNNHLEAMDQKLQYALQLGRELKIESTAKGTASAGPNDENE